ncbi:hypothetical protein OSTOST_13364 [Ostertagia ostertagi]
MTHVCTCTKIRSWLDRRSASSRSKSPASSRPYQELPAIDESRAEDLRGQRQLLQKEVEELREQCRMAEKFAETEGALERKNAQREEVRQELDALIEKHSNTLTLEFGSVPDGPWRYVCVFLLRL